MEWTFNGEPFSDTADFSGFVYLIVNKLTDRAYIGKKNFYFSKTKQVKGKKKRFKVESDWREYWSSSDELKEDVKRLGEENFTREILYLCKTKGEMNYLEAFEQFTRGVLLSDKYYNGYIMCRIHRSHVTKMSQKAVA